MIALCPVRLPQRMRAAPLQVTSLQHQLLSLGAARDAAEAEAGGLRAALRATQGRGDAEALAAASAVASPPAGGGGAAAGPGADVAALRGRVAELEARNRELLQELRGVRRVAVGPCLAGQHRPTRRRRLRAHPHACRRLHSPRSFRRAAGRASRCWARRGTSWRRCRWGAAAGLEAVWRTPHAHCWSAAFQAHAPATLGDHAAAMQWPHCAPQRSPTPRFRPPRPLPSRRPVGARAAAGAAGAAGRRQGGAGGAGGRLQRHREGRERELGAGGCTCAEGL
jgi:hypothetical protein